MIWLFILSAFVVAMALFDARVARQSRKECEAIERDCETGRLLTDWLMANERLAVGCSLYAQKLVRERIAAYEHLLATCRYIEKDEEHLRLLNELLHEMPPQPPPTRKRLPRQKPPPTGAVSFFCKTVVENAPQGRAPPRRGEP